MYAAEYKECILLIATNDSISLWKAIAYLHTGMLLKVFQKYNLRDYSYLKILKK